jgi:hypothetical protein
MTFAPGGTATTTAHSKEWTGATDPQFAPVMIERRS